MPYLPDPTSDSFGAATEDIKARIDRRLRELRPMAEEYQALLQMREAMSPVKHDGRKLSRTRQFAALTRSSPGVTLKQAAEVMGVQVSYLYRVTERLLEEGVIRKEDDRWYPVKHEDPALI